MLILLPIETINREIDYKIMLAALLSGKKHKIFIGQHDFLMSLLPKMKNGLYIGKNIFHKASNVEKGERYYMLKEQGFDIIFLHEEGAVFPGNEELWEELIKSQYKLNFFDEKDRICVWGEFQANIDNQRSMGLHIKVTGHPRFDLYKKKWNSYFGREVESLKAKHGEYVLINGNYGTSNHGIGLDYIFSEAGQYDVENIEKRLQRVGFYTYSSKQMVSIIELTHHLAVRYPKVNFVYRPHPSESQEYYNVIFNGVDNIIVNHDGPIGAWILGAKAIIHDGCTTAIEATLAGIPVINFKPLYDERYDIWLPSQLGKRTSTIEEVHEILDNSEVYSSNTFEDEITKQNVAQVFKNFEDDSFQLLLQVIDEKISENKSIVSAYPPDIYIKSSYLKTKLKQLIASKISAIAAREYKYHNRKFYGFNEKNIEMKFKQAELVLGKSIKYKFHNSSLVEVL